MLFFFLVLPQVQICKRSVEVMDAVRRGAQLAIDECQFQFRNRRWNCSTLETMPVFGKVVTQGKTVGALSTPKPTTLPLKPTPPSLPILSFYTTTAADSNSKKQTKPYSWHLQRWHSGASYVLVSSVGYSLPKPNPTPNLSFFFIILHELHR